MPRKIKRRRRAPRKKYVGVVYKRDGVTIRHIDILSDNLPVEVDRLLGVCDAVNYLISPPRLRYNHPILAEVRYMVRHAKAYTGEQLKDADVECKVKEIGRLNHILDKALTALGRLKSEFPALEDARFKLRYGQTSKKREAGWNSFKKDRETEYVGDPEEREPNNEDSDLDFD